MFFWLTQISQRYLPWPRASPKQKSTHRHPKSSEALHGGTATGRMGLLAIEWSPCLRVFREMSLRMITRRAWRLLLGTRGFTHICYFHPDFLGKIFQPIWLLSSIFFRWVVDSKPPTWRLSVFSRKVGSVFWKVPSFHKCHTKRLGFFVEKDLFRMLVFEWWRNEGEGSSPWKTYMEPENHPCEKEKHLPNLHFWVPCFFLGV